MDVFKYSEVLGRVKLTDFDLGSTLGSRRPDELAVSIALYSGGSESLRAGRRVLSSW